MPSKEKIKWSSEGLLRENQFGVLLSALSIYSDSDCSGDHGGVTKAFSLSNNTSAPVLCHDPIVFWLEKLQKDIVRLLDTKDIVRLPSRLRKPLKSS